MAEPRVTRLVQVALDEGFAVDVLAHQRPGEPRYEVVNGARVVRFPLLHKQGAGALHLILEYVGFTSAASLVLMGLRLRRKYDVVQVSNPPDLLMLAAVVPKLLGSRVILDVHDFSSDLFELRFGGRKGSASIERMLVAIERWAAGVADVVFVPHDPYRREIAKRGTDPHKVRVIMNSPDERLLPQPVSKASSRFRVAYHGSLTPQWGVNFLIDAIPLLLSSIPDLIVEIYGEGDALPSLRGQAEALGVEEHVVFSGRFLEQGEVLAAVAGASVGVAVNTSGRHNQRALSTKLLEYVALGIPAVAADLATTREHFSEREVLYFEPGDSKSLAAAILEIARDPAAAERRAEAARRRYEKYRWHHFAKEYAAALRR